MLVDNTSRGAVFFDRDGTLNVEKHFLHKREDFEWTPGAVEAIRFANELGYLVVVVTNQSGVARGYFPESDVITLHEWMNDELKKYGAHIDAFYYCPHLPDGKVEKYAVTCTCRKPKPGLIEMACRDFPIDREKSFLIGDSARDIECARAAGVRGVLYEGGSLIALVKNELERLTSADDMSAALQPPHARKK